jgi:hypothetical protein
MLEIAAHPLTLGEHVKGGLGRARELIAEGDFGMDIIANGLYAPPSRHCVAEEIECGWREAVDLAVPAAEKKPKHLVGKLGDGMSEGVRAGGIWEPWVFKEEVVLQAQRAGRRQKSRAQIPERIAVFLDRNRGFHVHEVRLEQNRDA